MEPRRLTTNIVPPEGPLGAKIIFIGEAPGEEEDIARKPFVGEAGQLLNRCFNDKGIIRSEVLITNIFSQRPPRNNAGYFFNEKTKRTLTWEGQDHVQELQRWLLGRRESSNRPNLLVALGATAMQILTGKRRINKWRGSVLPCTLVPGFKVYPIFHPSFVQRLINEEVQYGGAVLSGAQKKQQQNVLPVFLIDLDRILTQAEFPEIRRPQRVYETKLGYAQICARLEALASAKDEILLAVDIETLRGEDGPILWFLGFSSHPSKAFTIPFVLLQGRAHAWSISEEAEILRLVSKIFLNPNVKKITQGGTYDLSVLGRYYGLRVAKGSYEDTMLCHHASYPYIKKGLDSLTSIYTWEPYYKDEGKVHLGKRSGDQAEAVYNCKDCCVTREVFPIVLQNSKDLSTYKGYRRTISVLSSLLGMMIRGVKIDSEAKAELSTKFQDEALTAQKAVNAIVGQDINLRSSDQKRKLLYGYLGLDIQTNRQSGKPTTDKEALQKLKKKYPTQEILDHIISFQKYDKLATTYTNMQVDADGRIHTSYGFVSTWRLNSSESPFGGGGNLQNIPVRSKEGRLVRDLFIPDPGRVLLACDLSQAEARVVAWESEDLEDIEMFLDPNRDIHWERTRTIFGIPASIFYDPNAKYKDSITGEEHKLKWFRDIGKTIVHATNYDMGPYKLAAILMVQGVFMPLAQCKKLMLTYRNSKPMLDQWKRGIREQLHANRTIISSFGRKRQFMARLDDNLYRAAYAFSPQNTVGELLEVAIQDIWTRIDYAEILLNVHDEVVMQLDPKDLSRALVDIRNCMEIPLIIKGRGLTIPCDFKTGDKWGSLKEIENVSVTENAS